MDIKNMFALAFGVIRLSNDSIKKLFASKDALKPAVILMTLGSFGASFGGYFFPPTYQGVVIYRPGVWDTTLMALFGVLVSLLAFYLLGEIGTRWFGSKMDAKQSIAVFGHLSLLKVLGLIPALSIPVGIWMFIVTIYVLHKHAMLSWGKLILLILVLVVAMLIVSSVVAFIVGALGASSNGFSMF